MFTDKQTRMKTTFFVKSVVNGGEFRNFRNAVFPYYKYNKPIRNIIFNFNKLVSDLDIDANTPDS